MVRSMRLFRTERAIGFALLSVVSSLQMTRAAAQLAPIENNAEILDAPRQLRLEVLINGVSKHYFQPFIWAQGRLSAKRGDLEEVGVKVPGHGGLRQDIGIDDLPGIRFRFNEPAQQIDF